MTDQLTKALTASLIDISLQLDQANEGQVNDEFAVFLMETVRARLKTIDEESITKIPYIIEEVRNDNFDAIKI